jgi:hypothetical protein
MPEQTGVPLDNFLTVVKLLFGLINNLTVSVMTLRAALMQQHSLPISAEELQRLDAFFQDYEPIRQARETMEKLGASKSEDIVEFLKNYKGPIQ